MKRKKIRNTTTTLDTKAGVSIVIPAAGAGYRMRSYGPKSLIKLKNNTNIITNQLSILTKYFDNPEIVLVSGFESDKLMNNTPDWIVKIENENYRDTNVVRSLGMGLRACTNKNVLIVYGDLVFNEETCKNLTLENSCLLIDDYGLMTKDEVGCNISDNKVQYLIPDVPNKWAQIAYITGKELEIFKKVSWDKKNSRFFGFEAINKVIEKGGEFASVSPRGMMVTDVDTSKDLVASNKIL